jgi:hypothetical protein
VVQADSDADVFEYAVTVTGDAEPVTSGSLSANSDDTVERSGGTTTITGAAGRGGGDTYRFDGRIVVATVGGPASVRIDGTEVPLDDLGMDHHIEIEGSGLETAAYEFSVDDAVAVDPDAPSGSVDGAVASGVVETDTHCFYFDGNVTSFTRDGEAGVFIDGTQVDPSALGTDAPAELPNRFVVDNRDAGGTSTYSFEVSGEVEKSYETGSIELDDTVDGRQVSGSVTDDVDAYTFSGDLQSLSVSGNGTIRFADNDGTDGS